MTSLQLESSQLRTQLCQFTFGFQQVSQTFAQILQVFLRGWSRLGLGP